MLSTHQEGPLYTGKRTVWGNTELEKPLTNGGNIDRDIRFPDAHIGNNLGNSWTALFMP